MNRIRQTLALQHRSIEREALTRAEMHASQSMLMSRDFLLSQRRVLAQHTEIHLRKEGKHDYKR